MPKRIVDSPEFTITLSRGMASRHRLPWDHVMKVLREFKAMLDDVGRIVQHENGVENPTGNFGIELLATSRGKVFRRGSIDATAAMTMDVANGIIAMNAIIKTANAVENKPSIALDDAKTLRVVRGLTKISEVQKKDRTDFQVKLAAPNSKQQSAKITESGVRKLQAVESEAVYVDDVTVYGKLLELRDKSQTDAMGDYIWGELRGDDGEIWTIRCDRQDYDTILPLFTKQVEAFGDAIYRPVSGPRLIAKKVKMEASRNYLAAFDEMEGADKDLYGKEKLEDLIEEARGGNA